jgi:hypothetical protein
MLPVEAPPLLAAVRPPVLLTEEVPLPPTELPPVLLATVPPDPGLPPPDPACCEAEDGSELQAARDNARQTLLIEIDSLCMTLLFPFELYPHREARRVDWQHSGLERIGRLASRRRIGQKSWKCKKKIQGQAVEAD